MIEKRFHSEDYACRYYTEIIDEQKELDLSLSNPKKNLTIEELVDLLNELHEENQDLHKKEVELGQNYLKLLEENEQLKLQLQNTCDQRDEFYRGARENANRVGKLEKENEQLQERIKREIGHNQRLHSDNVELHEENQDLKKANEILMSLCEANNIL